MRLARPLLTIRAKPSGAELLTIWGPDFKAIANVGLNLYDYLRWQIGL